MPLKDANIAQSRLVVSQLAFAGDFYGAIATDTAPDDGAFLQGGRHDLATFEALVTLADSFVVDIEDAHFAGPFSKFALVVIAE